MNTEKLLNIKVKDVMKKGIITVLENDTIDIVDDIMNTSNIHHIPVVNENNELKGILSKIDIEILKDWGTKKNLRTSQIYNAQVLSSQTAKDIMTKQVAYLEPNDTIEQCLSLLKGNKFHCVPILENQELIGMLTTYDLLNIAYYPNK